MITIERIGPGATIQDGGRPGHMHEGVPPGGPLVPELLAAANASLGNEVDAAVLEVPASAVIRMLCDLEVSVNGTVRALRNGDTFEVRSPGERINYLAVPGGFDVPPCLGGRGTLLVAGLGGFEGRALRAGDVLRAVAPTPRRRESVVPPAADFSNPIRVVPGPDQLLPRTLETLLSSTFCVGLSDRVGLRLTGATLPVTGLDPAGSMPMVRGAIQVTHDGTPIVLGPDHPTTGGYRVVAVVRSSDLGALARRPVGAPVTFGAA